MPGTKLLHRRSKASCPRTVPPVYSLRRERNTKRRGELAELVFLLIATRLGFGVSKPYGDSERYDFILDSRDLNTTEGCPILRDVRRLGDSNRGTSNPPCHSDRREEPALLRDHPPLWRIQVKCSTQLLNGLYRINAHRRSGRRAVPYRQGEIDFIAAYIIPEDTWYIIPLHAVRSTSLLFRRKNDHRPGLYDQYREAWHLLRPPPAMSS